MSYEDFLARKLITAPAVGLSDVPPLNPMLFPFQRDIVSWSLRRGRSAIWADCGMGKTPMQLEFAQHIPGDVLILSPLAVSQQTCREAEKFGIVASYARKPEQIAHRITVTNYEMLERFDVSRFTGVVLDESSILKAYDSKTRAQIIEAFAKTPFKLAATATPAPNDYMEIGNHAEFLNVMTRTEMLATFFTHDGGDTSQWRLKGHAESEFWRWLASWAVMLRKPSDLGYSDDGFTLPELEIRQCVVESAAKAQDGMLFAMPAATLQERIAARRASVGNRVEQCAEIVNMLPDDQWVVWCDLNAESDALAKSIIGAVEVRGSDSIEHKEQAMADFASGKARVIVSKPSICGFGMNWQHCANMAFVGLSDSYEQFYQAVRRCWRFGQKSKVRVHVITAATEGAVVANIQRKEADAARMAQNMVKHMASINESNIRGTARMRDEYQTNVTEGKGWTAYQGDCVEGVQAMPDDSIDFSIFSPPFASLYTYSNSARDMGNSKDDAEFFEHFAFLTQELFRVTKPGRLLSFHCMDMPTSKARDGVIGVRDFRGELIRCFEASGWVFHSSVVIWKDPVTAMQRTKALGLLHKTIRKDSAMSRQGLPDYLVTMRKPGVNAEPIAHNAADFTVDEWQQLASPVWASASGEYTDGFLKLCGPYAGDRCGIDPTETLQRDEARDQKDERHICPLQLEVIRRAIRLWTNPGDLVLSPFMGIGSEGYCALQMGREFTGIELKASYYRVACDNLKRAEVSQQNLFSTATEDAV
jgi:superfamily II DNA or RNA helicase